MRTENTLEHTGTVRSITGDKVLVGVEPRPACAGCAARKICDTGSDSERIIEVATDLAVKTGEKVQVVLRQSLGFRALFLGYLLPFLIVFTSLIVLTGLMEEEGLAGLIAIALLVPYYGLIYRMRNSINKRFRFTLKKVYP